jgi:hypothetical protein
MIQRDIQGRITDMIRNRLKWLNAGTEVAYSQCEYAKWAMNNFPDDELIGLEVGSAYGGGVEMVAKIWKGRGKMYGYDTFEGHPKFLAPSRKDVEAYCMDYWYRQYGTEELSYDYQRKILDDEGLDNVILKKGLINEHSFDDIPYVHFVMLDVDMVVPTRIAYDALKDKIKPTCYLYIHDALISIPHLHDYVYNEIIPDGRWTIALESPENYLLILKRKL